MSKNPGIPARNFLQSLSSETGKQLLESLTQLCEILENKVDPEPTEIRLVEGLYNIIESINTMEYNLRSYINEHDERIRHSQKLSDLLEADRKYGSSVMFD